MKFRLYIDEVGNSDLSASVDANHRYLSLTGVALDLDYVRDVLVPEMDHLKRRFFDSHPDDPVVFHRKELVNKRHPFQALGDPGIEAAFNAELLRCLDQWDYTVVTVVIDKLEHQSRYVIWRSDPYHYCMHVLLERYVLYLERRDAVGDVLAESRGGKEDMRLKTSFEWVFDQGTPFLDAQRLQRRLTSRQLKVKSKANNIAGLQLADLIAHPSYKAVLARHNRATPPANFGGQIASILEQAKYDRDGQGSIDGWGWKMLP